MLTRTPYACLIAALFVITSVGCNQEEVKRLNQEVVKAQETLGSAQATLKDKEQEWSEQLAKAKENAEASLAKARTEAEAALTEMKKSSSEKLAEVQATLNETKSGLDGATEKLATLQADLEKSVAEANSLKQQVEQKNKAVTDAQQTIETLEQELQTLKKEMEAAATEETAGSDSE